MINLNEYVPVKFIERDIYLEQFFKFNRLYTSLYMIQRSLMVVMAYSVFLKILTDSIFKE